MLELLKLAIDWLKKRSSDDMARIVDRDFARRRL